MRELYSFRAKGEDYELWKIKGVKRHIAMVFIAHALLELGPVLSQSKHGIEAAKAGACLDTIGSKCRRAYTEILTSFVDLVLKMGEKVRGRSDAVAAKIVSIATAPRVTLPPGFAKVQYGMTIFLTDYRCTPPLKFISGDTALYISWIIKTEKQKNLTYQIYLGLRCLELILADSLSQV